ATNTLTHWLGVSLRRSICSSNRRRLDSSNQSTLWASNVDTPSARRRTIRPFCRCTMRRASATCSSSGGGAFLALDSLKMEHDLECRRDFGNVLLLPLGRALEQPGQLPPGKLRSVLGRQMLFDECANVGQRFQRQ